MERRCFLSSASSLETTATITTRKSSWVNVATTQRHTRPNESPEACSTACSPARQLVIVLLVVLVALVTGGISAISTATTNDGGIASGLLSVVAISFGWVVTILLHWYWQQEALGRLYTGIVPLFLALLASVALILKFGSSTSHSTIIFPWLPLICYATLRLCCKRRDEYRHWGWPCHREENLLEGEVDLMV